MADDYAELLVSRAIVWLDSIKPGWDNLVNLQTLNLNSVSDCILGQVYGENPKKIPGYLYVIDIIYRDKPWPSSANEGFVCPWDEFFSIELHKAWEEAIRKRRKKKK